MKSLILLESPTKIKTFNKYINHDEFYVMATCGHIMDLSENGLSVNLETFEPEYVVNPDKEDIVNNIGIKIKKVKNVYLGLDNDREGEMIAFNNKVYFKLQNPIRILFNEITKKEILNAIENPTVINMNMVKSQQTRRIIDRFYGYLISNKLPNGCKSCGRVQSNIVKIIIEKEEDIQKYYQSNQATFYTIHATLTFQNQSCNTLLKNEKEYKFDNPETEKITLISNSILTLKDLKDEIIEQKPHDPFMTTTLQQQANITLKLSAKETDKIAQKLYENGHITYIRTDSIIISKDAQQSVKNFIVKNYENYDNETDYINKNEHTQGAHECIRPTNIDVVRIEGTKQEMDLYNLIWKRTVQSQMKPALTQRISIKVNISNLQNYHLEGKIETLIFNGFLILDEIMHTEKLNITEINDITWTNIEAAEDIKNQPSRYDEASLIKYLVKLSIVRPATCSSSISRPIERGYIVRENIKGISKTLNKYTLKKNKPIKHTTHETKIGSEQNKYVPTEMGLIMCQFLETNFSSLINKNYTVEMEKRLDDVANGTLEKIEILKPLYDYINNVIIQMNSINPTPSSNGVMIGNIDNAPLELIKSNKFGNFVKYKDEKINVKELYEDDMSPTKEDLIIYVKKRISKNIGTIHGETVILKRGLYGYYCTHKTEKLNVNDFCTENPDATNEEIIEYLKENKIPDEIGRINNLNVILKTGKNGKYLNYDDFNYNVNFMFEEETPTHEALLNYLKKKLQNNVIKKEWIIKKNRYVFKKGQYGYFMEEYKNDEKVRNININAFIEDKLLENPIETVLDKITKTELSEIIKKSA